MLPLAFKVIVEARMLDPRVIAPADCNDTVVALIALAFVVVREPEAITSTVFAMPFTVSPVVMPVADINACPEVVSVRFPVATNRREAPEVPRFPPVELVRDTCGAVIVTPGTKSVMLPAAERLTVPPAEILLSCKENELPRVMFIPAVVAVAASLEAPTVGKLIPLVVLNRFNVPQDMLPLPDSLISPVAVRVAVSVEFRVPATVIAPLLISVISSAFILLPLATVILPLLLSWKTLP